MTLTQYIDLLQDCTKLDTQLGIFPTFVNAAIQQICQKRSWGGMRKTLSLTILTGNGSVALPSTFKEPQGGKNPLRSTSLQAASGFVNWQILSKQEFERLYAFGLGLPERRAYIDLDGTGALILVTAGQMAGDTAFELDAYSFFADLSAASDSNFLTNNYPLLVLEQAKVFAWNHAASMADGGEVCRQRAAECQMEADRQYDIARQDDAYRQVRGRNIRMGGV